MKLGIYGNNCQAAHLDELRGFLSWLRSDGPDFVIHGDFAAYLRCHGIEGDVREAVTALPSDVSMVISVGGDGTFLHAADWVGPLEIPIMGINTGHLGYLTAFSFSDIHSIREAIEGHYEISSRMTIEIVSPYLPADFSPVALNEVSIAKGDTTSMVDIRADIDGKYLAEYMADGLIIATPTGSTAYNLSCGGPILQPTLDSMILSPIAPHSLTLRPLVVDSASELTFQVSSRGDECHIGVDGRTFSVPGHGAALTVKQGAYRVNVVQPLHTDFARILRNKLNWGG